MRDVHTEDCLSNNEDSTRIGAGTINVAMFLEEFNEWSESGIS